MPSEADRQAAMETLNIEYWGPPTKPIRVAVLRSADKFAVASPRVLEADAAPVELAVKFGEAVLMFGRARSVRNTALPANVQAQLDALVADGILDAQRRTYRASHIALYSCYQLACAPARSTDNQMAQVTDAGWQTH